MAVSATFVTVRGQPRVSLNRAYLSALSRAGLMPVVVPPLAPAEAPALLARVDGLVLTGGTDVDARLYGQAPHPATEVPNTERDAWELALVLAARERAMPTLAICRGMQIANVALGGTMVQDIPTQRPGSDRHTREDVRAERVHPVDIDAHTRLTAIVGDRRIRVNSLHHQSVDAPGAGLRITARAPDGIVEALEWTDDDWWMLGVQWHPEELDQTPEAWDRALFTAFSAALRDSQRRDPRP